MSSGCLVNELHLSYTFFSIKVNNVDQTEQQFIEEQYRIFSHSIELNKSSMVLTFKEEQQRKTFAEWFKFLKEQNPEWLRHSTIENIKNYNERRGRTATASLKLKFWASEQSHHKKLCAIYLEGSNQRELQLKKNDLLSAANIIHMRIPGISLKLTKAETGFTVYLDSNLIEDDYELIEALKKL